MSTGVFVVAIGCVLCFLLGNGLGYAQGRNRSLPLLKPGQRVCFRNDRGWKFADLTVVSYSDSLHEGAEVLLQTTWRFINANRAVVKR